MRQAVNPAAMDAVGARHRRFRLQVDTRCPCKGCVENVQKAMNSIRSFSGVEKSEGDVHTGIVTVTGKVNQTELCEWLKGKTRKHVQIVCPDLPPENRKQKLGSSSGTGSTKPSSLQLVEAEIRALKKVRDKLKIKNLENELNAANRELRRLREVISKIEKALLK